MGVRVQSWLLPSPFRLRQTAPPPPSELLQTSRQTRRKAKAEGGGRALRDNYCIPPFRETWKTG